MIWRCLGLWYVVDLLCDLGGGQGNSGEALGKHVAKLFVLDVGKNVGKNLCGMTFGALAASGYGAAFTNVMATISLSALCFVR